MSHASKSAPVSGSPEILIDEPSTIASSYKQRLDEDRRWALTEGGKYFSESGEVHETLKRICNKLNEMKIPYAVVGGLALFQHGYRRFTEDVDILVTKEGLKSIHRNLRGKGYLPPHEKSRNLRDTLSKVKIEFLVAGGYPGDGKESPLPFPMPDEVFEEHANINWLNLQTLVELKIASGLTGGSDRAKDIIDVIELIKELSLPKEFGDKLNPYVKEKYYELWQELRGTQRRYITIWRNKFLAVHSQSLEEMIAALSHATNKLKDMLNDGVVLDPQGGTGDDYAYLVTNDPEIAKKYEMEDEREFFDFDEEDSP